MFFISRNVTEMLRLCKELYSAYIVSVISLLLRGGAEGVGVVDVPQVEFTRLSCAKTLNFALADLNLMFGR